jgi:IS4 transposase
VGEANTNDYEEIKALEKLTDLEVQVRRLNDRVVDIRKEQAYYKVRVQPHWRFPISMSIYSTEKSSSVMRASWPTRM